MGSPSFVYHEDVSKLFKTEINQFYRMNQRIFNFHNENDPIPMLLTGNSHLQKKHVSFREVAKCSLDRKLEIASNYHLGNNFMIRDNIYVHMERDEESKNNQLMNGAKYLWNDKGVNMRQMLTLFAMNHWPHHYKKRLQKILQNA